MGLKVEVIAGRWYWCIDKHVLITPHALERAKQRGVGRDGLLQKIIEEKEELKDVVANTLSRGKVRGYFYLTFPNGKRGKILWELMSPEGKRYENTEEVVEDADAKIVLYTYLSRAQMFFNETPASAKRRKRDNRKVF